MTNTKLQKNQKPKIIVLILITLFLGLAIYNQQKVKSNTPLNLSTSTPVPAPNLTEDEKFILNPPPSTSSAEVKQKHADTVAKLAKTGNSLEIKDCKPNILVLQVKQGSNLDIKNLDNTKHKLTFDSEHIFEIEANSNKTIKVDFKYGTGDYGYVCEGLGLTGFLHIIP